jgi:hypothetical protein
MKNLYIIMEDDIRPVAGATSKRLAEQTRWSIIGDRDKSDKKNNWRERIKIVETYLVESNDDMNFLEQP